jgi:mono/diheme cytochrome c family protein
MRHFRVIPPAAALLLLTLLGRSATAPDFENTVQPFLAKNCFACHSAALSTAGLNLQSYKTAASVLENRDEWEKVLKRISTGQMPPKAMPRPDADQLAQVTAWIQVEFERADRNAKPDPGRVTARRLNRAEYNNTVHDLLGINFEPADDFPQDDAGYGFDNNGDVLSLSVVQMEKYLAAAETIARTAVYGPQTAKAVTAPYQPAGRRRPGDFDNLFFNTHPWLSVTSYDETGLMMPNSFHVTHFFPVTGDYVIRATPDNGARPPGSEPLEMAAFVDGVQVGITSIDGELEGKTQQFPVRVTAGEHWVTVGFPRQFEGLPPLYGGKNPSKRPIPPPRGRGGRGFGNGAPGGGGVLGPNAQRIPPTNISGVTPPAGAAPPPPAAATPGRGGRGGANAATNNDDAASSVFFTPAGAPPGTRLSRPDNMGIQSMEIGGPANADTKPSPESLKKIFICGQYKGAHPAGCDRQIVTHLARLAYRRPVTKQDVDQLMAQATRARLRGDSFEEQIVVAMEAMLVSPSFLFRIEKDPPRLTKTAAATSDIYRLSDYDLASRLSYFLWSSMPDDELMRAAELGTLHRSDVLHAQVRRMLKDPKIDRLAENFGGQWLQFRALESHQPDFYKFPLWDNYMRISAVKETELFFENIVKEDRSITDFLDADYTFANQYLADFYGIHDVKGPEFRKMSLAATPRRGLLGQVSVLTASSYGNRTSVVLRGKWILENILNAPPPPPPPNVPDLDQAKVGEDATLRERMGVHRANPVCASCHSKMDPLGFGLENFDAIGSWRDKDGKSVIDASGTLPDGKSFNGPAELAKTLVSQRDAFAQCLTEKMLTFALGRGVESFDRLEVRKITADIVSGKYAEPYKFSNVVLGIVDSVPFQMRRIDRSATQTVARKD